MHGEQGACWSGQCHEPGASSSTDLHSCHCLPVGGRGRTSPLKEENVSEANNQITSKSGSMASLHPMAPLPPIPSLLRQYPVLAVQSFILSTEPGKCLQFWVPAQELQLISVITGRGAEVASPGEGSSLPFTVLIFYLTLLVSLFTT